MLFTHLKVAFRSLWWNKTFSAINIMGLSLGMAAAALLALWVQNERSVDAYHRHTPLIRQAVSHIQVSETETWHWTHAPMLLAAKAEESVPEIDQALLLREGNGQQVFEVGGRMFKEKQSTYAYVDERWFSLFDHQFVAGDGAQALANPAHVVITAATAQRLFGKREALGQRIRVDSLNYVVAAVMHNPPANSSFRFDYLMPLSSYWSNTKTRSDDEHWGNFNYRLYVRLKPGAKNHEAADKITRLLRDQRPGDSTTVVTLASLNEVYFDDTLQSDDGRSGNPVLMRFFTIIGGLILLIACINYVSLSTAKAGVRAKEVSVKKMVGAGRWMLFRQFMTESALTSFIALAIALATARLSLPFFNQLMDARLAMRIDDPVLWAIFGGVTLLSILLTGVYPAALLASFQPIRLLRGGSWLSGNSAFFRKGLVVGQFLVSTGLILSAIVIYQQLRYVRSKDLGYQKEHVFTFYVPWQAFGGVWSDGFSADMDGLKQRLLAETSITAVARTNSSLVNNNSTSNGNLEWEGQRPEDSPTVTPFSVDPDFQTVTGLQLTEGRWFEAGNTADLANYIINETAVRVMGLKPPYLGQPLTFQGEKGQIIGIASDFHFRSLHEPIAPVIISNRINGGLGLMVKPAPGRTAAALAAAEKIWKDALPDRPFEYEFEDDNYEALYQADIRLGQLLNGFAGLAIFISCLGLFGLAAFSAERRSKEIGIRKVLGASAAQISGLLARDFVRLVLVAIVLGLPLARYALEQWLQDFAYRIDMQWWMFAAAALLAMVIALLAVSIQSARAALADPVKSIRTDA
jgi:predicted permease